MEVKKGSTTGAALILAGTSIGGGMLALPVVTSMAGFLPSLLVYFLCYLAMMATGFLYLEVCLWMGKESNIISMAKATLGPYGRGFAWFTYLFLFYCLTIAYIDGGGRFLSQMSEGKLSDLTSTLLFLAVFIPFVYKGAGAVDKINRILMLGLGASFLFYILYGFSDVQVEKLQRVDLKYIFVGFPLSLLAFGCQGTIPSIVTYLGRDPKRIRKAIFLGASIPFFTYILWQILILGTVPFDGEGGLKEAFLSGNANVIPETDFKIVGYVFAFCALVTSMLGVTLGLVDFLADGLRIKKTAKGKLLLCVLVFAPPFLVSLGYERVFLIALDYAGGIGGTLLLGILPILMVYSIRKKGKGTTSPQLIGGDLLLGVLFIFIGSIFSYKIFM